MEQETSGELLSSCLRQFGHSGSRRIDERTSDCSSFGIFTLYSQIQLIVILSIAKSVRLQDLQFKWKCRTEVFHNNSWMLITAMVWSIDLSSRSFCVFHYVSAENLHVFCLIVQGPQRERHNQLLFCNRFSGH